MDGKLLATAPDDWGYVTEKMERAMGFEPTTPTLARLCSTPELHPRGLSISRVFLGWTCQQLADRAFVALNTVIRLEQGLVAMTGGMLTVTDCRSRSPVRSYRR